MEKPFPGMDPYLETPSLWPDVHHRLITAISDQISGKLPDQYTAAITPYIALESIEIAPRRRAIVPDIGVLGRDFGDDGGVAIAVTAAPLTIGVEMEIPTRYAQIDLRTVEGDLLVTSIELLSPVNKRPGVDGLDAYAKKRRELFDSTAHLFEIDLLRAGQRLDKRLPADPYFMFCSRSYKRPGIDVWPLALRAPIPRVAIPLRYPDPDIVLDLGQALRQVYANAHYERRIDYSALPPAPDFSAEDLAWIDAQLREHGLR